jgi:ASC-1-like (ASCH) protein
MNVKHIAQPWFDAILSGKKTYEGRVCTVFWKNLNIGSRFQITDGVKIQEVEVEQLFYFNNFGDAWFTLQDRLIPSSIKNIVVRQDAVKLYSKYYSEDDIQKNGVVVVKFKIIK